MSKYQRGLKSKIVVPNRVMGNEQVMNNGKLG